MQRKRKAKAAGWLEPAGEWAEHSAVQTLQRQESHVPHYRATESIFYPITRTSFWVRMSNNVTRLTWVLQLHQSSLLLLQLHDLLVVCIFSPLAWTVLKPSTKYTAACGRAQWSKVHRTGLQDVEELRHENVDDLCL
jgi:hypothetical protein